MENILAVTSFLRAKIVAAGGDPMRETLTVVPTTDNHSYYRTPDGDCYRVYLFIENAVSIDSAPSPEVFAESARAFGHFQYTLRDFPAQTLQETIVDFHNTPVRYEQLRAAISADPLGRAASVLPEINFILEREQRAGMLQHMRDTGELPVRVTHNDTKINNVLLDADTRRALCVIDLDTVMPGLSAYDFGDAIRFGASTAAEDEQELERVRLDLNLCRVFTRGFAEACPSLTERERDVLPLGAFVMTLECGMRFLTDYINGDKYFSIDRESHNLDRARTQLKLIREMESHWDELMQINSEEAYFRPDLG